MVLPYIEMNLPQAYMCSPSWIEMAGGYFCVLPRCGVNAPSKLCTDTWECSTVKWCPVIFMVMLVPVPVCFLMFISCSFLWARHLQSPGTWWWAWEGRLRTRQLLCPGETRGRGHKVIGPAFYKQVLSSGLRGYGRRCWKVAWCDWTCSKFTWYTICHTFLSS